MHVSTNRLNLDLNAIIVNPNSLYNLYPYRITHYTLIIQRNSVFLVVDANF